MTTHHSTITTTIYPTEASSDEIEHDRPGADEKVRRSARPAKILAVSLLIAVFLLGGAVGSADAQLVGGGGVPATGVPGATDPVVRCRLGQMSIGPLASVQANYTNGQYISFRAYYWSNKGHAGYTAWSQAQLVQYANYHLGYLPSMTLSAAYNTVWSVQVQFAYWRLQNGRWVVGHYSNFQPARYFNTNACYT